jgi:hypothetical protein
MTYPGLTPQLARLLHEEWLRQAGVYRRYDLADSNRPGLLRRVGTRLRAAGQGLKARSQSGLATVPSK